METNITATTTGFFLTDGLSGEQLQIAILVTLFLGILLRTYVYFMDEKRKSAKLGEPPLKFDFDFVVTAIIAAVGSGIVALLTFRQAEALVASGTDIVGIITIVGGFAFGTNELLNKVLSFINFNRLIQSPKVQEAALVNKEVQKIIDDPNQNIDTVVVKNDVDD
jgi:undecaprenyl pyrophosphate phosphatase UppP